MKYWLDYWLGRLIMYRVVLLSLAVVYVVAMILSAAGMLAFTPTAMLVSVVVLLIATYASNRLFAWLFGVCPHGESSVITALILFFLFVPKSSVAGLLALSLVGMVASASKYLLVVRGRHIFNPVAVAAVAIGFSGVAFATWWVATPALLPITLVSAFVILYKTRRMALGMVFVGLAVLLLVMHQTVDGESLTGALNSLASWPVLFFAGFMLSEPLTLPPRRWQQLLVATLVAVLFALAPHVAGLSVTPPIALLVGNMVAFIFTQRHQIQLRYVGQRQLTPSNYELIFKSASPLRFTPGQYMELTLPHSKQDSRGARRMFSIASRPGDSEMRFGVKLPPSPSSFKRTLFDLSIGARVAATGISGDFILPRDQHVPILMIAGGIGVTPFISQLLSLQAQGSERSIGLIYAVNGEDEIAYRDELIATGIPVTVVSRDAITNLPKGWKGVHSSLITHDLLASMINSYNQQPTVYISGPPLMVTATKEQLRRLKVRSIKTDYFTGY